MAAELTEGPLAQSLTVTAFRGDPDVDELHAFFQPDHHFVGHTRWSFGTSLKSAYVNSFEFMNHAPVVQLWRDVEGITQAVSRLSLGTAQWFHLARPAYRDSETTSALIQQADAAFDVLTDHAGWSTVRYQGEPAEIDLLERSGYHRGEVVEVYMTRPLDGAVAPAALPSDVQLRRLDRADAAMVHERAMAQVDAFTEGEPTEREMAWITRTIQHQLHYGTPDDHPCMMVTDSDGSVLAFADIFFDRTNKIGEFEPVGTRKTARHRGLGKAAVINGLHEMKNQGMTQAVVRTGSDNPAAIATYESAGFKITDRLVEFRKHR